MKVVWTEEASRRLEEIETFIAMDSPSRAAQFVDRLIEAAEKIGAFPYRGRVVPEFASHPIRELLVRRYRIVYLIKSRHIEILTVFEGHQQFPQLM